MYFSTNGRNMVMVMGKIERNSMSASRICAGNQKKNTQNCASKFPNGEAMEQKGIRMLNVGIIKCSNGKISERNTLRAEPAFGSEQDPPFCPPLIRLNIHSFASICLRNSPKNTNVSVSRQKGQLTFVLFWKQIDCDVLRHNLHNSTVLLQNLQLVP